MIIGRITGERRIRANNRDGVERFELLPSTAG